MSLNEMSFAAAKETKNEIKRRGLCNSITKGILPKREPEKALRKLAEQNARRGCGLEICKKMLKRRDEEIQSLKEILKFSDKKSTDSEKMANSLERECNFLEKEFERCKKEREQLKRYSKALETQIEELKNDYQNHKQSFHAAAVYPSSTVVFSTESKKNFFSILRD